MWIVQKETDKGLEKNDGWNGKQDGRAGAGGDGEESSFIRNDNNLYTIICLYRQRQWLMQHQAQIGRK